MKYLSLVTQYLVMIVRAIGVHLWLMFATAAGVVLIWFVPQVSNLWQQTPYGRTEAAGFATLLLVLVWLYPVTLFWLWQRTLLRVWQPDFRRDAIAWCKKRRAVHSAARWIFGPARLLTSALFHIASYGERRVDNRWKVPIVIALIVGGHTVSWITPVEIHVPWPMFGSFVRMSGFWMMLTGIWLTAGYFCGPAQMLDPNFSESSGTTVQMQRTLWRAAGRVLSLLATLCLLGEILWATAVLQLPLASLRLYSIWAAIHIPVFVAIIAACFDFAQCVIGNGNFRLAVALIVLLFLILPWSPYTNTISDPVPAAGPGTLQSSTTDSHSWLKVLEKRLESIETGPVVLVSASGGGSRAALFTSLVLQHLAKEPIDQTASTATSEHRTWSDNILLISSVSGGSLASARYAASPRTAKESITEWRYSTADEVRQRALEKIPEWMWDADPDSTKHLREVLNQLRSPSDQQDPQAAASAVFSSQFVDDMAADFVAPMLRGLLTPFSSRGDALYHFWEHQFGWHNFHQQPDQALAQEIPAKSTRSEEETPGPLTLFNTTDVETGRRVIVGFPLIPRGFLLSSPEFPEEILDTTSTHSPSRESGPVSLADFTSADITRLSLTRAVRLSSNFPWGFSVEKLNSDSTPPTLMLANAPSVRGENRRTEIELIDGGVVDNTGIDSIAAIFDTLLTRAQHDPFGRESLVLQKMREKTIVLLEIDSGAKPTASRNDGTPFAAALRPLTALNNSTYSNSDISSDGLISNLGLKLAVSPTALQLNEFPPQSSPATTVQKIFPQFPDQHFKAALSAVLSTDAGDQAVPRLQLFTFTCNHLKDTSADVMTSFALGPADKATIVAQFLMEAKKFENWQRKRQHSSTSRTDDSTPHKIPQNIEILRSELLEQIQRELEWILGDCDPAATPPPPMPWTVAEQTVFLKRLAALAGALDLLQQPDFSKSQNKAINSWISSVQDSLTPNRLSTPLTPADTPPDTPPCNAASAQQFQLNYLEVAKALQITTKMRRRLDIQSPEQSTPLIGRLRAESLHMVDEMWNVFPIDPSVRAESSDTSRPEISSESRRPTTDRSNDFRNWTRQESSEAKGSAARRKFYQSRK
jgi:hypothetical protein